MSVGIKEDTQIIINAEMDGFKLRICPERTILTEAYRMLTNLFYIW